MAIATFDYSGRHALITGGTSGIGLGIARGFADAGATVTAFGLGADAAPAHPGIDFVEGDVTDQARLDEVASGCERIDAVVTCAGLIRRVEEHDPEVFAHVLDVNLTGSIVNIASIIGTGAGMSWRGPYGASKAGVVGLTQVLGAEWMGRGVRVNALLPGPVMTDMVRGMIERGAVSERNVVDRTPAGRFGAVDDVADAVLLLAADESAFITGQAIAVDGGYTQWAASHEASRPFGG